MKEIIGLVHRTLAQSRMVSRAAVKIRNQAAGVISRRLGETPDSLRNGEFRLIEHLSPQIKTFVDVGANVGDWSGHLLNLDGSRRGVLFEPSVQCLERLRERFSNNDVVIRGAAVSDFVGITQFVEEANCGEGSSIVDARRERIASCREVLVTTLDAEFPGDECIDFLKIDVEGFDLKVLMGGKNVLSRVRYVQFEYNSYWLNVGSSLFEAMRYLKGIGYSVFLIRSSGLHPLQYEIWGDYFSYSNFLACRNSDMEYLRPLIKEAI